MVAGWAISFPVGRIVPRAQLNAVLEIFLRVTKKFRHIQCLVGLTNKAAKTVYYQL